MAEWNQSWAIRSSPIFEEKKLSENQLLKEEEPLLYAKIFIQ